MVLGLELSPHAGWELDLSGRDISVIDDDLGRASVSRDDARRLIAEHRASQSGERERLRRHREETERQAAERDQEF